MDLIDKIKKLEIKHKHYNPQDTAQELLTQRNQLKDLYLDKGRR